MEHTMTEKFVALRERLRQKIAMSATPVKGFILGLSGTDSIITFMLLAEAAESAGISVTGVHYVNRTARNPTTFQQYGEPWLREHYPETRIWVVAPDFPYEHQFFIADLHCRAVSDPDNRLWVASTMNATEKYLGTYSILEKGASIAPIASMYKSEVIEECYASMVPDQMIESSRIPDCACGRDEFAASNIGLIDDVIRHRHHMGSRISDVFDAQEYISKTRAEQDFKNRTPYNV